ncbi:transporter [Sphingomonas asaccharolytica]|uniref:transporter n=1 Tax=Sphingomonas asaccharolytica TaxID=40681 RepID=UPI001FE1D16A|nr:transporter [Sphingomonas asaccharolytica]
MTFALRNAGIRLALVTAALFVPAVAQADDKDRDYCPARPGLGTPACTMAPGQVSVETSLGDWTLDKQGGDRTDTVLIGDTSVRIGLTDTVEAQVGWTPLGIVRERAGGVVDRAARAGDATLGIKANLRNPDGSGLSVAVQPFVTLPVGRAPIGAGDWGAGLVVPVTYDLSKTVNLEVTPEVDAAVDQDGRGRHLAYSAVVGVGIALNDALTFTLEDQLVRDQDPSGSTTQDLASASLAWMPRKTLQLDVGAVAGLDRNAPDVEIYAGIARRF